MSRARIAALLAGAAFLGAAAASGGANAPSAVPVAFVHANVVTMDGPDALPDQTVVVSGGRITALGPSARAAVPRNARVVDAKGRYLSPGLADMHVHLYFPGELPLYPLNGVTSVLNLNGRPPHLSWRRRVADGELLGPTIYSAGPTFDHPRSAEDAVAEVDRQSAAGYDAVKIYNQVRAAEYPALTAEAKKKGLVLVGHVAREPGFAATLAAGQSIAHAEEYVYTFFNDDPDPRNEVVHPLDTMKIPEAVAMSRDAGISVIATLVAFHNIERQATDVATYLRNPDLAYLPPSMRAALAPERNTYANRWPPDRLPGIAMSYDFQGLLVKALHDGGVPILAGTDASWLGVPGFSLVEEVENFQDLGFTPYAALRTATIDAAKFLRRENDFGRVAVGLRADLLLTPENPLRNVRALRRLSGVMVAGRWIDDAERRNRLAAVPGSYRASLSRLVRMVESDPAAADRELADNDPFGNVASAVLVELASAPGTPELGTLLVALHRRNPDSPLTSEDAVNQLGYDLLAAKHPESAVEAFRVNTVLYPASGNAYDSLAETYMRLGREELGRQLYAKALEVQPDYPNARTAREILAAAQKPPSPAN